MSQQDSNSMVADLYLYVETPLTNTRRVTKAPLSPRKTFCQDLYKLIGHTSMQNPEIHTLPARYLGILQIQFVGISNETVENTLMRALVL